MKKQKKLEINYQAYLYLLVKQKLPYIMIGFFVFLFVSYGFISIFIIRNKTGSIPSQNNKNLNNISQEIYTVKEGEDLWQIAEKYFGSGENAYDIAQANKLKEPYVLETGQRIIIPQVAKKFPTQGAITATPASTTQVIIKGNTYIVKEGDYLFKIAENAYGDGNMMMKIVEANQIPYPYDVLVGQQLKIPR